MESNLDVAQAFAERVEEVGYDVGLIRQGDANEQLRTLVIEIGKACKGPALPLTVDGEGILFVELGGGLFRCFSIITVPKEDWETTVGCSVNFLRDTDGLWITSPQGKLAEALGKIADAMDPYGNKLEKDRSKWN